MSTSTSSSYVFPSEQWSTPAAASDAHDEPASDNDDLDSLPSSIDSSEESSEYSSDAQKEWEASLQQIELLLTMVVVPYVGKYFGRKCAYWSESAFSDTAFMLEMVNGQGLGCLGTVTDRYTGWAKYMEWMYDVEVRYTNKAAFRTAGAVEAAATL
ncbi:hypothetical protein V492_00181 [Pseudogymnoascus sp. VKM F-4246]|nr:hypothetical protein V492_00181 [Pseudogymnoascus sp. VKM F-4246]